MAIRMCSRDHRHDQTGISGGKFCIECGSRMLERRCPNKECRMLLDASQKFCEKCGQDVREVQYEVSR